MRMESVGGDGGNCRGRKAWLEGDGVLFCASAVVDPRVGHTMDVLSPFIPVLCHSD